MEAAVVRRFIELVGWGVVAGVGGVMLTQAVGWSGARTVASLQALTPYGLVLVVVVACVAVWRRAYPLAVGAALVGISVLGLSIPLMRPPDQPAPAVGAADVQVAAVNLLFSNPRVDEVADDLMRRDADVVVFSEFTDEHRVTLLAHALADTYPHKLNREGLFAGGMAVWSKFPLIPDPQQNTVNRTISTTFEGPDGPVRLLAVHPPTPVYNISGWQREIEDIGKSASSAGVPTLVIGDFNASYWHPNFRDVLDRGFTDAHMAHGRGWTTSWPTDEAFPPFVRLDHALTNRRLVSTAVDDFRIPGSDHAGLIVTVKMAETAET